MEALPYKKRPGNFPGRGKAAETTRISAHKELSCKVLLLASLCFWRCCILCAGSGRRPDPEGAAAVVAAAAAMLRKTVRSHVPLQGMHKNVEWLIIFFYQAIEIRIQFVIAEYFLACARSRTGRPVSSFPGPQRFSAGVGRCFRL